MVHLVIYRRKREKRTTIIISRITIYLRWCCFFIWSKVHLLFVQLVNLMIYIHLPPIIQCTNSNSSSHSLNRFPTVRRGCNSTHQHNRSYISTSYALNQCSVWFGLFYNNYIFFKFFLKNFFISNDLAFFLWSVSLLQFQF